MATIIKLLGGPPGPPGKVSDVAYDATAWNGVTDTAPSKNAVRDVLEGKQPLDADLTAYANAADAAARRVLIGSEDLTRTAAQGAPGLQATLTINEVVSSWTVANGDNSRIVGAGGAAYASTTLKASAIVTLVNAESLMQFTAAAVGAVITFTAKTSSPSGYKYNGGATANFSPGVTPDRIGQFCRVGDAAPFDWYQASTLTTWEFVRTDGETSSPVLADILTLLGVPTKADLATANTDLAIGKPFYNTALSKLDITTA